jgi:hypothetical protein
MEKKNKKPAKEAPIFPNILAASVKGNPKPKPRKKHPVRKKNIEVKELIIKAVISPKNPTKK